MKKIFIIGFISFCVSVVVRAQSLKLVVPIGHTDNISSIACSPDGKYLVTGSWDKTIKLWEVNSGKLVLLLASSPTYPISIETRNQKIILYLLMHTNYHIEFLTSTIYNRHI